MNRRQFLSTAAAAGVFANAGEAYGQESASGVGSVGFELDEVTVSDLGTRMRQGALTSERIVELYLERIGQVDRRGPTLPSVIEVNPDALAIARSLDAEWKSKGPRSPLHGIPVLLKDNIDTADKMQTTAGSLALVGQPAAHDSGVAAPRNGPGGVVF